MCRFVAFKGKKPIILKKLLGESQHSLIIQSRLAKETKTGLNADGFGVGWYDHEIDGRPAVFRSIQPAWNDENLINISSKVRSSCFIGHVRASTVGDVNIVNCHPFAYKEYLFAHNGTIHHFDKIKKDLLLLLDEERFNKIKGQTDSEHFFMLVCNLMENAEKRGETLTLAKGLSLAIEELDKLLDKHSLEHDYRINAVFTDGKKMTALRFTSNPNKQPHTLYYSQNGEVIIASERLSDKHEEWHEIPTNHFLSVDEELNVSLLSFNK